MACRNLWISAVTDAPETRHQEPLAAQDDLPSENRHGRVWVDGRCKHGKNLDAKVPTGMKNVGMQVAPLPLSSHRCLRKKSVRVILFLFLQSSSACTRMHEFSRKLRKVAFSLAQDDGPEFLSDV